MESSCPPQPQPPKLLPAKRALFSDEKRPAPTRPRMTLTAIAMANPTPAVLQEGRRAAPGTATTTTATTAMMGCPSTSTTSAEDAPVTRRLFAEAGADRGASSSPPRFKATRALFAGTASPGRWLDSMEKQQVRLSVFFLRFKRGLISFPADSLSLSRARSVPSLSRPG